MTSTETEPREPGFWSRTPLFPALIPSFAVCFLLAHNTGAVDFQFALIPLLGSIGVVVALQIGLAKLVRSSAIGAWAAAIIAIAFFGFGHLYTALTSSYDGLTAPPAFLRHRVLFPVWCLVAVGLFVALMRRKISVRPDFGLPNTILTALVLFQLGSLVMSSRSGDGASFRHLRPVSFPASAQSRPRPNIYFLLLDGYGREDLLRESGRGDIRAFRGALEGLGFRVSSRARSNYLHTYLSLSTTLNMVYADDLAPAGSLRSKRQWLIRGPVINQLVQENRLVKALKGLGYRYMNLPSQVSMSHRSRIADINYGSATSLTEFNALFLSTTALAPFLKPQSDLITREDFEKLMGYLDEARKAPGPKYVFGHILLPHPPYLHRADGRPAAPPPPGVNRWSDVKAYAEQTAYLNQRIEAAVRAIVEEDPSAVIVLAGDHGPAMKDSAPGATFEFSMPEELRLRSGILLAIRVPETMRGKVRDDLNAINTFRFLLRELFGASLPDLEEATYRLPDRLDKPFERVGIDGKIVPEAP